MLLMSSEARSRDRTMSRQKRMLGCASVAAREWPAPACTRERCLSRPGNRPTNVSMLVVPRVKRTSERFRARIVEVRVVSDRAEAAGELAVDQGGVEGVEVGGVVARHGGVGADPNLSIGEHCHFSTTGSHRAT